jgi:glucokinase
MMDPLALPLAFPFRLQLGVGGLSVLAGDVGGTKTNLAIFKATRDHVEALVEKTFHSSSFPNCTDILVQFLQECRAEGIPNPDRISLGVAGPVVDGKVELTNLDWVLDVEDIKRKTGISTVSMINDLEATAFGLAALGKNDFMTISEGSGNHYGNMAIIAPGTGLGEGGMYWDGSWYHPFPTEGGHTDFSPRTDLDIDLLKFLQKIYGVVSWEKVIAGPAIHDIYHFLLETRKKSQPLWLKDAMQETDPSAVISLAAVDERDPICMETMELFVRYLARESANLVLKMKATGGLFLGGGIPPKISSLLLGKLFYAHFMDCDRMEDLLKNTPIRIILSDKAALLGAGWYGAYASR